MAKSTTKQSRRKAPRLRSVPKKPKYLTDEQLEALTATIVMSGDETVARTNAFILLMDEVERAQFDRPQIDNIQFVVKKAAFARSDAAEKALDELVKKLRAA